MELKMNSNNIIIKKIVLKAKNKKCSKMLIKNIIVYI